MRLLSVDNWDLPCALNNVDGAAIGGSLRSGLRECERVLESLRSVEKVMHLLKVATPAVVVTKSNR